MRLSTMAAAVILILIITLSATAGENGADDPCKAALGAVEVEDTGRPTLLLGSMDAPAAPVPVPLEAPAVLPWALFASPHYILTPVTGDNAMDVARVIAKPDINFRYGTLDESLRLLEALARGNGPHLAVVSKASGKVVGYASAAPSGRYPGDDVREYEVRLRMARPQWGALGESEVLQALLRHSMVDRGAHSVLLRLPRNAPDAVLDLALSAGMENIGFSDEQSYYAIRDASYWINRNGNYIATPVDQSEEEF